MSTFFTRTIRPYRSITFLCQQCHGDLELTAEKFAGDPVWRCRWCPAGWIWTLAGWGRLPS